MLASVADYRDLARRRLARFAFDYLDRGAEDGAALARNRAAFDCVLFATRILEDVCTVDTSVTVAGRRQRMPVVVGPTGLNGLYWPRAEETLAQVAQRAGVPFVLSTASTSLLEDVRAATDGDLWLQLYVQQDRTIAQDLMRRARACGYTTLMLTVDTPVHGKRDHDVRNGFRMPLPITPRFVADLVAHPRWCVRMLRQRGSPQLVNLARSAGLPARLDAQAAVLSRQMDASLRWDAIAWLREHWPGNVIVKGILSVGDARQAVAHGADGIVLSNHGGRQLASVQSPLEILPAVIEAVGERLEVLVDGGVRRGSDVAKARALGARAVLLGRAPLFGLAATGRKGAAEVLDILRDEYEIALRLIGCPSSERLDGRVLADGYRARLATL